MNVNIKCCSQVRYIVNDYNKHVWAWHVANKRGNGTEMAYEKAYTDALAHTLSMFRVEYGVDHRGIIVEVMSDGIF